MAMAMNPIQVLRGGAEEEKVWQAFMYELYWLKLYFFTIQYFRQKRLDWARL